LGPYHQLTVVCCGKLLVPKDVLEGLDGLVHIFRNSVETSDA
jgi:hypothetical protein